MRRVETTYILALVKGDERFVFVYDDNRQSIRELFCVFGRLASNPEASFTWYDAALMSKKLRDKHPEPKSSGNWKEG